MSIKWDESLLLGNADIDEHHRQIFVHFEKLSLACIEGQSEDVLKELLKYLDDYTSQHFLYEEAVMAQHNYPRLQEQKAQHTHFRQIVKELQEMDIKDTGVQQLSLAIYRRLTLWFTQHIKQLDQDMVNFILAQQHY